MALLYQNEVNHEQIPYLLDSVEIITNHRVESQQQLVSLLNLITNLRNKIQEETEKSEDVWRRIHEIHVQEVECALDAVMKEKEAVEKGTLSEEAEHEALRIERVIGSIMRSA